MDMSRIGLMEEHLKNFEEKLESARKTFSQQVFSEMLKNLNSRPSATSVGGIENMKLLRKTVEKEGDRVCVMFGESQLKWDPELLYFNWFFGYYAYLRELADVFAAKLQAPLEKYCSGQAFLNGDGSAAKEVLQSAALWDLDKDLTTTEGQGQGAGGSTKELRNELKNLSGLYNTDEILEVKGELAKNLQHLRAIFDKEWDHSLVANSIKTSTDKTEQGSSGDLDSPDLPLVRLVPDILRRFQKAADLAGKWLELDRRKSEEVPKVFKKLKEAEQLLLDRLDGISERIRAHEHGLDNESKRLERLLEENRRESGLNKRLYAADREISRLQDELVQANKERDMILLQLKDIEAVTEENEPLMNLRYQQNKLHRFALDRDLSARYFHKAEVAAATGDAPSGRFFQGHDLSKPVERGDRHRLAMSDGDDGLLPKVQQCMQTLLERQEYLDALMSQRRTVRQHLGDLAISSPQSRFHISRRARNTPEQLAPEFPAPSTRHPRSLSPLYLKHDAPFPNVSHQYLPSGAPALDRSGVHLVYVPRPSPGRKASSVDGRYVQVDETDLNDPYTAKMSSVGNSPRTQRHDITRARPAPGGKRSRLQSNSVGALFNRSGSPIY